MKKLILLCVIGCLTMSCESFLTQNPIDQMGDGDYYTNDEEINAAVVACYNGLQAVMEFEFMLTEVRSDNARIHTRSTTSNTSDATIAMDHLRVETTHSANEDYWEAAYHNIANCNTVLQYLDVVQDTALKAQFKGEALFLRSYHYFNLVRLYGPLFKVTERISADDANSISGRVPVEEIYDLVIENLKEAADLLPPEQEEVGRVTSWAAKTLLAKVYLTLDKTTDAETLLLDVEKHSGHDLLLSSYADVFSIDNEMNKEIIFAVQYIKGGYGLGSPFANYFAPNSSLEAVIAYSGIGYNCPTHSLMYAYEEGDLRKDVTLSETYTNLQSEEVNMAWVKKYHSEVSTQYDAENDWPVLRFADVLLMLAETKLENEGVAAALPYLNRTRERAGLVGYTDEDIENKLSCQLAIENERRFEFAFENHRFFDLLRTERLVPVMEAHFQTELIQSGDTYVEAYTDANYQIYMPDMTVYEWQKILPIPFSVISVAENVTQNPGY